MRKSIAILSIALGSITLGFSQELVQDQSFSVLYNGGASAWSYNVDDSNPTGPQTTSYLPSTNLCSFFFNTPTGGGTTLQQTFTNLTAGQTYDFSFELYDAQATNNPLTNKPIGDQGESMTVAFGTFYKVFTYSGTGPDFSGVTAPEFSTTWQATSSTETLSFTGIAGAPAGYELGDVSLKAVPEPSAIVVCGLGLASLVLLRRKHS